MKNDKNNKFLSKKNIDKNLVLYNFVMATKYLAFYDGKFSEFDKFNDLQYFLYDKPKGTRYKKITSKKAEDEFRKSCKNQPEFQPKIYVVIVNEEIKRFESWKDCEQFKDKHKDARYKSFISEEAAQNFINANTHGRISDNSVKCKIKDACIQKQCDDESIICEIIKDNTVLKAFKANNLNKLDSIQRECFIVLEAIKWAIKYNEECIVIEYNNQGIEMWANNSWKTNKEFSKKYQSEINELKNKINIEFRKKPGN